MFKEQIKELKDYPIEVINSISDSIEILEQDKLSGIIPEYIDVIECERGVNYNSSLFLHSSDFSILVITHNS